MAARKEVRAGAWLHRRQAMAITLGSLAARGSMHPASAQGSSMTVPFEPGPAGGLPAGFSTAHTGRGAAPTWKSIADPAVGGGHVLAQTSPDPTDYRFPLAIYDPISAAGIEVTVRFKAVAGR